MTQKNTGGPAFPVIPPANEHGHSIEGYPYPDEGMTLRDYFAALAMSTICVDKTVNSNGDPAWVVARLSYAFADAMIEARDK